MGAGIFGLLNALGDLGQQNAQAQQFNKAQAEERAKQNMDATERWQAAQEKRTQFAAQQAAANAKKPLGTPFVAGNGKMMQRYFDPMTRAVTVEEIGGPAPETQQEQYYRGMIAIGNTPEQARKLTDEKYGIKTGTEETERTFLKSLGWSDSEIDEAFRVKYGLQPRATAKTTKPAAGGGGRGGAEVGGDKTTEWWAKQIMTPGSGITMSSVPVKLKEAVAAYMQAHGENPRKLTNQEQQSEDAAKTLIPMLDNALTMLEPMKNQTGAIASAEQHAIAAEYAAGISPGKKEEELIQTVSFLQNLGVQPWTKVGRGRYIYEQLLPHLPKATDAPGLMYEKIKTLQKLVPQLISGGATETAQPGNMETAQPGDTVEYNEEDVVKAH